MRPILSIRLLLCSPIKTLVSFLLLAASAFALSSRVAEYAVTAREYERVPNSYRGVGAVEVNPPGNSYI